MNKLDKTFLYIMLVKMSELREASPVKLFTSLILSKYSPSKQCTEKLEGLFGKADFMSDELPFDLTNYYERSVPISLS